MSFSETLYIITFAKPHFGENISNVFKDVVLLHVIIPQAMMQEFKTTRQVAHTPKSQSAASMFNDSLKAHLQ